ncbi:MAG: hypothetical protein RBS78_08110 [Coriobacteriia bacterium]|nr:hypothetical protein [Coriobacteriia bacterium]
MHAYRLSIALLIVILALGTTACATKSKAQQVYDRAAPVTGQPMYDDSGDAISGTVMGDILPGVQAVGGILPERGPSDFVSDTREVRTLYFSDGSSIRLESAAGDDGIFRLVDSSVYNP